MTFSTRMFLPRTRPRLVFLLATATFGCASEVPMGDDGPHRTAADALHKPLSVGVRCEQTYQDDWQPPLGTIWDNCWNFGNEMSKANSWDFYYNLHGADPALESRGDRWGKAAGGADSVDFLFMSTHGLINRWDGNAEYEMWDKGSSAFVSRMRLGDSDVGLSALATYSCETMRIDDGHVYGRWISAFAGGLRIAHGAHGLLYDVTGYAMDFAQRIELNSTLNTAWASATLNAEGENAPMTITTGRDKQECWRRHRVTIATLSDQDRIRDADIGYMCSTFWN